MGKSSPSPPSPAAVSQAQSGANKESIQEAAKVNAVDQYAPWGNTTFARDGNGVPTRQNITLNPTAQRAFDAQQNVSANLADTAQTFTGYLPQDKFEIGDAQDVSRIDYGNIVGDDVSGSGVGDALYQRTLNRIQPQLDDAYKAKRIEMESRGLPVGSEIYNDEMNRLDRNKGELLSNAALEANLASGAEQSRLVGLLGQGRSQDMEDRSRQISERLMERTQPFNELSAFVQGSPALPTPQFQSQPAYSPQSVDVAGNVYSSYALQANQAQQQNANLWGGISRIGSAAIPFL